MKVVFVRTGLQTRPMCVITRSDGSGEIVSKLGRQSGSVVGIGIGIGFYERHSKQALIFFDPDPDPDVCRATYSG